MILKDFFFAIPPSDNLCLSYKKETLTYKDFFNRTQILTEELLTLNVTTDSYYIIDEENPLRFYPLLLATWLLNLKVIFPNKDFFLDKKGLNIHHYTLAYCAEQNLSVTENPHVQNLTLPENGDTVVFSSGSTGKAKGILHNKIHFLLNALNVVERTDFSISSSITLLKPYLVSALSHFLVHFKNEAHLAFIDMNEITLLKEYCDFYHINSIVGSPMHIVNAYQQLDDYKQNIIRYFSSGDIMYPNLIEKIVSTNKNTIFYNVYGLAELAGRFFINRVSSTTPLSHYDCMGQNISGTSQSTQEGQMTVSSPFLFFGYIIEGQFIARDPNISFRTGDMVQSDSDCLQFIGRSNDEIKVAGNKVSLKNIEKKIASIFPDETVIITNSEHKFLGNLLNMIIYGKEGYNKTAIIERIHKNRILQPYEIPHMFYRIGSLPYTTTMKIDRNEIKKSLDTLETIK
jgi:acyl-coenzyme A synthetase/AMP-(fatty) acid ligase